MDIFLSWSGDRSRHLAIALKEWMPLALQYANPWMSSDDIQPGERWSTEIAKKLEDCHFGILCITRENLDNPWILFEAGALAKSVQYGRVIPLLLDVDFKSISGPLAQFQAKKCDLKGLEEIVFAINTVSETPLQETRCQSIISAMMPNLIQSISEIPKTDESTAVTLRTTEDILEEVVATTRSLDQKFEELSHQIRANNRAPLDSILSVPFRSLNALSGVRTSKVSDTFTRRLREFLAVCENISAELTPLARADMLNYLKEIEGKDTSFARAEATKVANRMFAAATDFGIVLTEDDMSKIEMHAFKALLAQIRVFGGITDDDSTVDPYT